MLTGSSLKLVVIVTVAVLATACASNGRRAEFSAGYPVHDCPEHLQDRLTVTVNVRPIGLEPSKLKEHSITTSGAVGRRVLVSVVPNGLHSSDRIVWSSLAFVSYGGTFVQWSQLQTSYLTLTPSMGAVLEKQPKQDEVAAVSMGPGEAKVVRSASGKANLIGASALDVLIMPGGSVVEDAVLRIPNLWTQDGRPVPHDEVIIETIPIRHPPGLDTVEASFELTYVLREGRSGDEWICSTEGRATLVDHDAVRQRFWDLGIARKNTERSEWLALHAPSIGALRTVFESPVEANALASWIQTTGSVQIGEYEIGVFTQSVPRHGRPFGPLDANAVTSLRPLTDTDIAAIRVGAAGER